jgi:hypothetical protein
MKDVREGTIPPFGKGRHRHLSLPKREKNNFRLGRRAGVYQSVEDLSRSEVRKRVERALQQIESERPGGIEKVLSDMMESFI